MQQLPFIIYLCNTIVFPVLIEALSYVHTANASGEDSYYAERRWYRTMEKKLEQKNINLEDRGITAGASILLGGIVQDALISLDELIAKLTEEE